MESDMIREESPARRDSITSVSYNCSLLYKTRRKDRAQRISGKATVSLEGDTLILRSTERRFFRKRNRQVEVPLHAIVNVEQKHKCVLFKIRSIDDSGCEYFNDCCLTMKTKGEADDLVGVLPTVLSSDKERLMSEMMAFETALDSVTRRIYVTPLLFFANVVVFVIMVASGVDIIEPTNEALLAWGADFGPLTLSGQYWRLLSSIFIHIGIAHIGFNMWALATWGVLVERLFGDVYFALIYLATGILASMATQIWLPESVAAGASGAIFGVYGALAAVLFKRRSDIPLIILRGMRKNTFIFVAIGLIGGFCYPGINNYAHIGGFISGIAIGYVLDRPLEPSQRNRLFWPRIVYFLICVSVLTGAAFYAVPGRYKAFARFTKSYEEMEELSLTRHHALARQYEDGLIEDVVFIDGLEQNVLPVWQSLADQASKLDVSGDSIFAKESAYMLEVATLHRDALHSLIEGLRSNNQEMIQRFNTLQEKLTEVIEKRSTQQ